MGPPPPRTTARAGSSDRERPIQPSAVRNLALEGGGGKGLAYLGALTALESLGVLGRVTAVSGSSAGAITALLLALEYSPSELDTYLKTTDFTTFFDRVSPRRRPRVGEAYEIITANSEEEDTLITKLDYSGIDSILGALGAPEGSATASGLAIAGWLLGTPRLAEFQRQARVNFAKPPADRLVSDYKQYIAFLGRDMGLFSGEAARDEFDRLIRLAIRKRYPNMPSSELESRRAIRFEDMSALFPQRRLIVTGSNLSTGRTQVFSSTTTPRFPVPDAVRISMGLPFIYKPYVLQERPRGYPPCGTYVDGGLWNNIPFREFGSVNRDTLGLRLELVQPEPVESLGELLGRTLTFGLFGTGESQALDEYSRDLLILDTRGLDLIDFNPPKPALEKATKRAVRAVYDFWSLPIPSEYRDPQDEAESARLRAAANQCVGSRSILRR